MQSGQGKHGKADVEQAEDRRRRIRHHMIDGPQEGAVDEQPQRKNAEDRFRLMEPCKSVGKQPCREESADRNQHGDAWRIESALPGETDVLPRRQHRHCRHRQRKNPLPARPQKHQKQNQRNQKGGGKYSFHSGLRIHRWGWGHGFWHTESQFLWFCAGYGSKALIPYRLAGSTVSQSRFQEIDQGWGLQQVSNRKDPCRTQQMSFEPTKNDHRNSMRQFGVIICKPARRWILRNGTAQVLLSNTPQGTLPQNVGPAPPKR